MPAHGVSHTEDCCYDRSAQAKSKGKKEKKKKERKRHPCADESQAVHAERNADWILTLWADTDP